MTSVFASLAKEDFETDQARSRALTAARVRAQDVVGPLLDKATSKSDFDIRLDFVDDALRKIAADSAREYGHPGIEEVYDSTREFLAAEPAWEDSYKHEREKLPVSDGTGVGDHGAVETDKGSAGDVAGSSLKPIDVDSQKNQLELQDPSDRADYNGSDFDPKNPVRERIDVSKPLQSEHNVADNTDTWSSGEGNSAGQADPVTPMPSGTVFSKYRVAQIDTSE